MGDFMERFVELSHVVEDGMTPYPGLPSVKIGAILDHATSRPKYNDKAEFYLGFVDMPTNVGTYIDAPFHRHKTRADLADVPLSSIADLPVHIVDAKPGDSREIKFPVAKDSVSGKAVIVRTGWDRRWGTKDYLQPGPFLSTPTAQDLVKAGARLVGVDFWNVDDTTDPSRPIHTTLLGSDIPIVEHMTNLSALTPAHRFFAVAPRIRRGASFPIRAFGVATQPGVAAKSSPGRPA